MDLCTQAHDIIRTWLFSRVVRAHFEDGTVPVVARDDLGLRARPRPQEDEQVQGQRRRADRASSTQYGTDAVRWRAASPRPGLDSPFDETQMKVGRRLAMKVLNASKFVLGQRRRHAPDPARGHRAGRPRDAGAAGRRSSAGPPTRSRPTTTRPRSRSTEKFFWEFCDDYLELVKERAYGAPRRRRRPRSAQGRARDRAARPAAAARAVPALRDRGGLVVVAGRARSTGSRGRPPPSSAPRAGGRPGDAGRGRRPPRAASAAPSRRPRSRCAPSCPVPRSPAPPRAWRWPSGPPRTSRPPARSSASSPSTPADAPEITVDAEIAPQPRLTHPPTRHLLGARQPACRRAAVTGQPGPASARTP